MAGKQYAGPEFYEKKLAKVMERFGTEDYNYDWSRHGGWVEFRYRGQLYRFEHSVEKAQAKGQSIKYGSDAFAQIVLALEDLARLVERGLYDLQNWIEGMRFLPPPVEVPEYFKQLGFETIPGDVGEVEERFRVLAKQRHPDVLKDDGTAFKRLQRAAEDAKRYFRKDGGE
ncbi:hypothetical protein RW092_03400 [Paenibacillus sp. 3LSP]|uniref:hypothetical protein n=1 Tax=Paenibacillus sp. 3LSP TaxID=2800795 RepID=UPI0028FD3624|nr:hypothetical protein [Paenibacillus sp. 3LSP]MDU0329246.1 hypothetical protein [Paenibacillus sp. 3LSP]